jgi:4-hydroxyphenylpyruvate dioxygenase
VVRSAHRFHIRAAEGCKDMSAHGEGAAATAVLEREGIADTGQDNPAGIDGIEFIEYWTSQLQAFGQELELMGFRPVARHARAKCSSTAGRHEHRRERAPASRSAGDEPLDNPAIAAVAFRVRDASYAITARSTAARGPCRRASR